MARNINFIWNPQVSVYVIKFDYDKQFVDVIKSAVPGNCRTYDTQTREWYVTENYFDGLKMVADAILKPRGYKIYTFTRAQAEEFNQPAQNIVPVTTYFSEFCTLAASAGISVDTNITQADAAKIYKRLAMHYHPDRNAGAEDNMARLNVAWKELKNGYWGTKV